MAMKIVEIWQVSPSSGGTGEQILPLTYFDVAWLPIPPTQTLYFYDFQHHDESHFLGTTVPQLKNSLSLTLKHFLPLAGKIVFPLPSSGGMPFSHYADGEDSLSLTIAVSDSDSDFLRLTGNDHHSRPAAEFHDFVPPLPPAVYSSDSIRFSTAAIRVTLFPSHGICIGITNHHAICGGFSLFHFLNTWASINAFNGDDSHLSPDLLPSHDRSSVSQNLTTVFWNHVRMLPPAVSTLPPPPAMNVRGTFVLTAVEIRSLKKLLNDHSVGRVSSNVAICALVWSCMAAAEDGGEDEAEYLSVSVDCRGRMRPTLPQTYFGNCSVFTIAESTHGRLKVKGKEGFVAAARAIAAAISKAVDGDGGVLGGAEEAYLRRREVAEKRLVGVGGSPRFDAHCVDFGWGGLRKLEYMGIDHNGAMGLFKSKQGGVEIHLSIPNPKMIAFAEIFNTNLSIMINSKL